MGDFMKEIINKKGKFWISNKKNSFNGEITYENNQFYLNPEDTFKEFEYNNIKIIKGIIENIPITLYKCHLIDEEYFMFKFLFKNHANTNLFFRDIEVKFNNMENLIRKSVVTQKNQNTIKILADKEEYQLDNFKLTLFFNKHVNRTINTFNVTNDFKIKIEYLNEIKFDKILEELNIISNFLSICMYKQSNIQSLKLENSITVFNQFFNDNVDTLDFYNAFIDYDLISGQFGDILGKWFEIYDIFKNTIYLYLMNISYKTNAETMFLTYSQSLEAFIRKNNNFKKFYMNFKDYDDIKDKFYEVMRDMDLESNHRQSLKSRIKYGNEYSLRKRLKILIDYLEGYDFIENINEKYGGKFINYVVDTRNYYTHYGDEGEYKTSGGELLLLAYDLKLLLELCLLHELNLSKELINLCLSKKMNNVILL